MQIFAIILVEILLQDTPSNCNIPSLSCLISHLTAALALLVLLFDAKVEDKSANFLIRVRFLASSSSNAMRYASPVTEASWYFFWHCSSCKQIF